MKTSIRRWGNSLAVRLPKPLAAEIGLSHDSEVDLRVDSGTVILTPLHRPKRYRAKDLAAKITPANLPASDSLGQPIGKEVW